MLLSRLGHLGFKHVSTQTVRYPTPQVTLTELTRESSLLLSKNLFIGRLSSRRLPGYEPRKRAEPIVLSSRVVSDAIAFMGATVQRIAEADHHPRWENISRRYPCR